MTCRSMLKGKNLWAYTKLTKENKKEENSCHHKMTWNKARDAYTYANYKWVALCSLILENKSISDLK